MRPAALGVTTALLLLASSSARADGPRPPPGWYLPIGGSLGFASHPHEGGAGVVLGGEASIVHLDRSFVWWGAYGDGVWDPSRGSLRWSFGPELGWLCFGLDGGPMVELRDGHFDAGFSVRPLITFGPLSFYARWGHLFNGTNSEDFAEFGAMLKVPIRLSSEGPRDKR